MRCTEYDKLHNRVLSAQEALSNSLSNPLTRISASKAEVKRRDDKQTTSLEEAKRMQEAHVRDCDVCKAEGRHG